MNPTNGFEEFQGISFSQLFASDIADGDYAFILNYPATASWIAYPNKNKYLIQDGSDEANKTSYDKIFQKEAWKNLAVLGDNITGVILSKPSTLLLNYWQEHFGFKYSNIKMMQENSYLDELNQSNHFDKIITLFPFDSLELEKHAVSSDMHYHILSKATLNELGVQCPKYETYNLHQVNLQDIQLPEKFPYLIKTSHGLSGEGTYIINNSSDLNYCFAELRKYVDNNLLETVIVSEWVYNVVQNYCVQFYISKTGTVKLIGTTSQLVTPEGNYLGGLIHYRKTDTSKFFDMISAIGEYAYKQGYFGVIGFDVLENQDGELYVIDANFRVNGSTPLCLQRQTLLQRSKEVAKYCSDYWVDDTLESILETLKPELNRKDFIILSALEKVKDKKVYTEMYGIIAGETVEEMQHIEKKLQDKGFNLC